MLEELRILFISYTIWFSNSLEYRILLLVLCNFCATTFLLSIFILHYICICISLSTSTWIPHRQYLSIDILIYLSRFISLTLYISLSLYKLLSLTNIPIKTVIPQTAHTTKDINHKQSAGYFFFFLVVVVATIKFNCCALLYQQQQQLPQWIEATLAVLLANTQT